MKLDAPVRNHSEQQGKRQERHHERRQGKQRALQPATNELRREGLQRRTDGGRMMGETLAQTLCGNRIEYKPGHWFNSAKFFDIEYQTYGWVHGAKGKPDYEEQFHWIHKDDDKCLTVAYHRDSNQFLGINTFGMRMRHETFDRWLTEERDVFYVLDHLAEANFDPEFYKRYENDITTAFKKEMIPV